MDAATDVANTFTVSSSDITAKFTIESSATEFTIHYADTTMQNLLGLTADLTSVGHTLTFQASMDMLTTKELQIHMPGIVRSHESTGGGLPDPDLILMIPLANSLPYTYISEDFPSMEMESTGTSLYQMTLSITDQTGYTPVDWDTDRYPFTLIFRVTTFI